MRFRSANSMKEGTVAHRYVDMWAFMGVHPTNMEICQRLKMADDRQFTSYMDVCGTVSERDLRSDRWEKSHLVGIRTDAWNPNRDQQERALLSLQQDRQESLRRQIKSSGPLSAIQMTRLQKNVLNDPVMKMQAGELESRRLVMKLFRSTTERIRWVGSLEEVTTREVHNSLGSKRAILSFAASLDQSPYLTDVQENHRTFRIPSIFTFCYYDPRRGRMWYVNIKRKWISIGADFVIETEGRKIGDIDGALIGFGYNAHVYLYEPDLAHSSQFMDLITLFTTSVGYQGAMRRSVKRRVAAGRKGFAGRQIVEDEELKLLKNPRAA